MSDTEQLFVVAAVWALFAAVIARFIPNWPGRVAFFALAVGIPFWEIPYGYYNFRSLCVTETSLAVSEKIPSQNSVCIDYFDLGLFRQLTQAGFARIEVTGRSENAKEHVASGRVFLTTREQAKSTYCLIFESNISMPWRILRSDTKIVRLVDRHPVARQSRIRWDGTWWQKAVSPTLGIGGVCSGSLSVPILALRHGAD